MLFSVVNSLTYATCRRHLAIWPFGQFLMLNIMLNCKLNKR